MNDDNKITLQWDIDKSHPELGEKLRQSLREIHDPEIGLNIIELGLVRNVSLIEDSISVNMILTTPFCPYGPMLLDMTKNKAKETLNLSTNVELGIEMWDFSMMEAGAAPDWGLY